MRTKIKRTHTYHDLLNVSLKVPVTHTKQPDGETSSDNNVIWSAYIM